MRGEAGGQFVPVHLVRALLEQREQAVAVLETRAVAIGEAHAQFGLERSNRLADAKGGDEAVPLLGRQCRDHEAHAVAAAEIAPECAPDRIAQPFAVAAAIEHFGHRAAIGQGPDRDIAQRYAQFAALTRDIALAQRSEQREGAIGPGDEVPCGQHLVDRRRIGHVPVLGTAHQRIAARRINGEIHRLAPIVPAHDAHAD